MLVRMCWSVTADPALVQLPAQGLPRPTRCPYCPADSPPHWIGWGCYQRYAGDRDDPSRKIAIPRWWCKLQCRTFSLLPDCLLPYHGCRTAWLLAWGGSSPARMTALTIYGLSLVALFASSGIYHAVSASPRTLSILRKVDHSAIFLLIAGTYTPFCMLAFTGAWRWGMLAVIWSLALAGAGSACRR